jgi:hypothetical protein
MTIDRNQQTFLEALSLFLETDPKTGLVDNKNDLYDAEQERGLEYNHNEVYDQYRRMLEAKKIIYMDPIMSAFKAVHDYKYIDGHGFSTVMERQLKSQGIPSAEISIALDELEALLKKLQGSAGDYAEKDSGLLKNMNDIKKVSQPEQPNEFTGIASDLNKKNVEDVNAEFE